MISNILFTTTLLSMAPEDALRSLRQVFIARITAIVLINVFCIFLWIAMAAFFFAMFSHYASVSTYIWLIIAVVQLIALPFEVAALWWRYQVYRSLILARSNRNRLLSSSSNAATSQQTQQARVVNQYNNAYYGQQQPPHPQQQGYNYYPSQQPQPQYYPVQTQPQQQYVTSPSSAAQPLYPQASVPVQQQPPPVEEEKQHQLPPQTTFYQV